MSTPLGPRNRRKRSERIEHWNESGAEGRKFQPRKLDSKTARYEWLGAIMKSNLPSTTRLVSHTLVYHGRADGSSIYPTTRRLAAEAGLSQRAVCNHLDLLVRRGWMHRQARHGDTAGAAGFEYVLCIPNKLEKCDEGRSAQLLNEDQHRNSQTLKEDQHGTTVLNALQHSAERGTGGAERGSKNR